MRFRLLGGLGLLLAPTPCLASYEMVCTGKGRTPTVTVMLGSSEMPHATGFEVVRGGRVLAAPGRNGLVFRNRSPDADTLVASLVEPKKAIVADLRLKPRARDKRYIGTLLLNGRKYWLTCEEMG